MRAQDLLTCAMREPDLTRRKRILDQYARASVRESVEGCTSCQLRSKCKSPVPFTGKAPCWVAFFGEAPGPQEDEHGVPFYPYAPAGEMFTKALGAIGLRREDVFIANTVSCWPWELNNAHQKKVRQPTLAEFQACRKNFQAQLAFCNPRVCVLMGETACWNVLKPGTKIAAAREIGQHWQNGVTYVFTYHPAYAARNVSGWPSLEADFQRVGKVLEEEARKMAQEQFAVFGQDGQIVNPDYFFTDYAGLCEKMGEIVKEAFLKIKPANKREYILQFLSDVVNASRNKESNAPHLAFCRMFHDDRFKQAIEDSIIDPSKEEYYGHKPHVPGSPSPEY